MLVSALNRNDSIAYIIDIINDTNFATKMFLAVKYVLGNEYAQQQSNNEKKQLHISFYDPQRSERSTKRDRQISKLSVDYVQSCQV